MQQRTLNVLQYLERSAALFPNKAAFADENNEITYSDLLLKARRMGSGISHNVTQNSPIAVLGSKTVNTVAAFFACVYAGCFYVPLNPLHPVARREKILETLDNPLVLLERGCEDLLPIGYDNFIYYDRVDVDIDEELLAQIRAKHIDVNPLYVMFTSGSTGTPKGIAVSHRSVIDFIEEFTDVFNIASDEVIGNQAPFDFDVSVKDIYSTIKTGATMQIVPKKAFSFPMMLIDFLIERKVTTLIWAVSALCILSTYRAFTYKIPDIKKVLFSGEAMPIKHLNIWKKYLPNTSFVNLYGPTEITCNCTYYRIPDGLFEKDVLPIGVPFVNEKVLLLSSDDKLITTSNETGEICVSGTCLSLGYYNADEETKKAFVQNPCNSKYIELIYKTGDLGYYDNDGNLCFVGRKDFQIKHMGHRIELSEIETALLNIKSISRAVCIYHREKGRIVAFYQGEIDAHDVTECLRKVLPPYMVPNRFEKVEVFALNENGKIDRNKLKEIYGLC